MAADDLRWEADHPIEPAHGKRNRRGRHNMLGVSMAPATGKLVAGAFSAGSAPHLDPRPIWIGEVAVVTERAGTPRLRCS